MKSLKVPHLTLSLLYRQRKSYYDDSRIESLSNENKGTHMELRTHDDLNSKHES